MIREIRYQASRDGDKVLATEFRNLCNGFHIFKYPIEFTERLIAIIQERASNIDLVLEDMSNQEKADTLEEFIFNVKMYLSDNDTVFLDWDKLVNKMKISDYLQSVISDLLEIIFRFGDDEEDVKDYNIQDIEAVREFQIEQFNNIYQLIAPTKDKQVQELTKFRIHICPSCKSP